MLPQARRRRAGHSVASLTTAAAALLLGVPARALGLGPDDYVCQLQTKEDEPLQTILGLQCTVVDGGCNCSASFLPGTTWHMVTREINESIIKHLVPPGDWVLLDLGGHCIAGLTDKGLPAAGPCPPGFYCAGGAEPPRSCSKGDHCPGGTAAGERRCPFGEFCPLPGAPAQRCPDGGYCPQGSTDPKPCEPGQFCKDGKATLCQKDHYCPVGADVPYPCNGLAFCPAGSKTEDVRLTACACLVLLFFTVAGLCRVYDWVVKRWAAALAICLLGVAGMWLVEPVLGGFLLILLVPIALNWALLQVGPCPMIVARILVASTLVGSVAVIWAVNPPWAVLVGGITAVAVILWLMARQHYACVLVGRALLMLAFIGLLYGYFRVDMQFAVLVLGLLVLTVIVLVSSWAWEQHRQRRRVELPFLSRWQQGHEAAFSLAEHHHDDEGGAVGSSRPVAHQSSAHRPRGRANGDASKRAQPPLPRVSPAAANWSTLPPASESRAVARPGLPPAAAGAHGGGDAAVGGVSFQLQGVSFDLPDGARLLQSISLSIAAGCRVAVMGPSGSGKSTLLAVLSGRASYGRVGGTLLVGGEKTADLAFLRHVTGFVPQDDVLHGELTAEENIRFQAALRLPAGTPHEEVQRRVESVAEDLHLTAVMHTRVGTPERRGLSGGQRKRVSIGMELVAQPLLLFADEPTSGLDSTTSLEVVKCLNGAAAKLSTTVIAVIHQPRYETLCQFDDLVLLSTGGRLVYAGETAKAADYFRLHLQVEFRADTNPADLMLDTTQSHPEMCAECWERRHGGDAHLDESEKGLPRGRYYRERPPFFRAVLIYMNRSLLQTIRASVTLVIGQCLNLAACTILCLVIVYEKLDQFMMQAAFAALFLMLLQGVAAQRIFGNDLLITAREARVGMPMVAYFFAKDLAALFEITITAGVFTAAYGSLSGVQLSMRRLFGGSWAFVYSVVGLSYIFSLVLSPGAAQMSAVLAAFVSFCVSGVYQPQLPELAGYLGGRGWMVPALSPIRWFWAYLLDQEAQFLTPVMKLLFDGPLQYKGYNLKYITCSDMYQYSTLREAWQEKRCWVCSVVQLLLLGIIFRFLAALCLMLYVSTQTSGWGRFFGQSEAGAWKVAGKFFQLLVGTFMALFLFAEVWVLGLLKLRAVDLLPFGNSTSTMSQVTGGAFDGEASYLQWT